MVILEAAVSDKCFYHFLHPNRNAPLYNATHFNFIKIRFIAGPFFICTIKVHPMPQCDSFSLSDEIMSKRCSDALIAFQVLFTLPPKLPS